MKSWEEISEEDFEEMVKIRRTLHQIPEIGLEEHETSKFVRNYLSQIEGIHILDPIPNVETAIIAIINVENESDKLLFRCELDALPWKENSGEEFSSHNGLHHACGHDAHMAIMLLACKKIASQKNNLKRSIIFCFQPGEEGKGGAKKLIENYPNIFNSVKYAFALHGGNNFSAGYALASSGIISANSEKFEIKIKGKGCHVMIPENGIDANFVGCNLVTQLYNLKQMKLSPLERGIVTVTRVEGGLGAAMISENFSITGTLRMISRNAQEKMREEITELTKNFCEAFGAIGEVQFFPSQYRSVENSEEPTRIVRNILTRLLPEERIKEQVPSFNGEDFCEFSERIPSCYFILGAGQEGSFNENNESEYPLHSNRHRLDEKFMILGVKIWTYLAFSEN